MNIVNRIEARLSLFQLKDKEEERQTRKPLYQCLSLVDTNNEKDRSIYSPVQALNDSPNRPPAIEMAHQFNYFTTQARPALSNAWHGKFLVTLHL